MEQLSIIMPCIINRGNWALCQVEPTIHPLLKVSLLSHCTLISISAARLIYYQKVEKRASVKMPTQGRGWGPLSFISLHFFVVVVVVLFWVKSAKTTKKETRFLVATWAKKQKRNWNFTTRTTLAAVNWLDGLMISGQSKTLSIVHILRKIKKRHRYWLSPVLISAIRLPYLEDVGVDSVDGMLLLGSISSLGCLDAPVELPTWRLGERALTNQKPARRICRLASDWSILTIAYIY